VNTPLKLWVAGARPRTFPAAIVPVAVGTAVGYLLSRRFIVTPPHVSIEHHLSILNAFLALVVALSIQIGTNYVNDYADGERGTDEKRVGPVRLVASKLATPRAVKVAALGAFAVAGVAGLILAATVTWWFIPLGLACGVAGWAYTGGPHPYGYLGFGELFVFVFFGLVATAGSAYVQHGQLAITIGHQVFPQAYDWEFALWAGVPVGFLSAALLQANNLRDMVGDKVSGKKTLAVRLGRRKAGYLYCATIMGVALSIGVLYHYRPWALIALVGLVLALPPLRLATSEKMGRNLLPMLASTARTQIAVGVLLTVGLLA
jgi:1,4-dihydroxy-2-naphthoate octaprenyltransferase